PAGGVRIRPEIPDRPALARPDPVLRVLSRGQRRGHRRQSSDGVDWADHVAADVTGGLGPQGSPGARVRSGPCEKWVSGFRTQYPYAQGGRSPSASRASSAGASFGLVREARDVACGCRIGLTQEAGYVGTVKENVARRSTFCCAQIRPPWASTIDRLTASPTPLPAAFVVYENVNIRS